MTLPDYSKYTVHDSWGHRLLRGFCSALVPGTGQLVAGARKRGYVLLGVVVAVLAALVLVVLSAATNVDDLLVWLISPSHLLGLLIVDVVLLVFRIYAVADAVWLRRMRWGSPRKRRQRKGASEAERSVSAQGGGKWKMSLASVGLVVLFAFTVFPHVWIGYQYIYKFRSVLSEVFAPPTTTTTIATTTSLAGSGTTVSTEPSSTTTTLAPVTVDAGADGRLTILFVGADVDTTRRGLARNDTTIVASFDMNTGRIALFSLPRNAGKVPLSEKAQKALGVKTYPTLLNEIYGAAWRAWPKHPELAPEGGDPGAEVLRDAAGLILGITIDYYAVVDMLGLVKLVDVMGGVDVYFDKPLHMGISSPTEEGKFLYFDAVAGTNHLGGLEALAYARTRHDSSDYVRMGRQRCLIAALVAQTSMKELVWNFPGIMDVIKTMVRTDIPISAVQELVKLRPKLKTDEMITVGFIPPRYTKGTAGYPDPARNGWVLNAKLIQTTVKEILDHPEQFVPKDVGADTGACWKKPQTQ
jgi:LCP family protein required for cell wall assembly